MYSAREAAGAPKEAAVPEPQAELHRADGRATGGKGLLTMRNGAWMWKGEWMVGGYDHGSMGPETPLCPLPVRLWITQ